MHFCLYWTADSREVDRKEGERGMTCNKDPKPESNKGRCGYVARTVTIRLRGHSEFGSS